MDFFHMLYRGEQKLGSCVAISAALLPQQLYSLQQRQSSAGKADTTSILITHGSKDSELPRQDIDATVKAAKQAGISLAACTTMLFYAYLVYNSHIIQGPVHVYLCKHSSSDIVLYPCFILL